MWRNIGSIKEYTIWQHAAYQTLGTIYQVTKGPKPKQWAGYFDLTSLLLAKGLSRRDLIPIGKPWLAKDPHNPCKEWRETGKHCSRCPYDPVCNN